MSSQCGEKSEVHRMFHLMAANDGYLPSLCMLR